MKKSYLVNITFEAPYPKKESFSVIATSKGRAADFAEREFKKRKLTTKRQKHLIFDVTETGTFSEEKEGNNESD